MKELYKLLAEYKVFLSHELDELLSFFGFSPSKIKRIKQKLTNKGILVKKRVYGEWIYVVNLKKLQELLK